MEYLKTPVSARLKTRLEGIAKSQDTSPDILARELLKISAQEIWKHQGFEIEEMLQGLEYFKNHLQR
jgi:hypothetical protein